MVERGRQATRTRLARVALGTKRRIRNNNRRAAGVEIKSNYDRTPRTFPQVYNALIVANPPAGSLDTDTGMLELAYGAGGEFGNIAITNRYDGSFHSYGMLNKGCAHETRTQYYNDSASAAGEYLWFSSKNIIYNDGPYASSFSIADTCTWNVATRAAR